jgi:predicted CopG family antitoxin
VNCLDEELKKQETRRTWSIVMKNLIERQKNDVKMRRERWWERMRKELEELVEFHQFEAGL